MKIIQVVTDYIMKSILTTQGDMVVRGAALPERLAGGLVGTVLTGKGAGVKPAWESGIPAGMITPYGGAAAPTGWLLCDGSAVSRTTYADLFAVAGVAYGVGDGSTTFNIPDFAGKMLRGNTPGATGGSDTHAHTSAIHKHLTTIGVSGAGDPHIKVTPPGGSENQTVTNRPCSFGAQESSIEVYHYTDETTPADTGLASTLPAYLGATFIIKT